MADAQRTGKERFPSGMRKVTDEIHSLGLKAGIVSKARSQRHPRLVDSLGSTAILVGLLANSIRGPTAMRKGAAFRLYESAWPDCVPSPRDAKLFQEEWGFDLLK